ncbi:NRPS-like enzyme [Mycena venus]|uniref:NRPS-like enzyme n=1 Tax=Mycena venus TaxID=2733690 RepID=A0A8H6XZB2_9AGAR|nr:NRPS-like enzyme [Mycena venus]
MTPYTLPCADGSLSLLQVMEFHAKANPDHPLFRYDSASAREGYEDITWRQAMNLFDTTAQIIRRRLGGGAAVDLTPPPVVGILASTSAILYACLLFGTLRAGCPVFLLSTRNSDVAIAHLIAESGVKYLLVSQDAHMQDIARKANGILQSKNVHITLISIPTYEEICADEHEDRDALPALEPIDDDHVLIIAHSSGSTSFPKIIPLTQKYFIKIYGPRPVDLSTTVQAAHGAAMFHAMGILSITRAVFSGMVMSLFPPTTNTVITTPERVLSSALSTKSTTIVCPPIFLEHWAHDPASVEKLRTFAHILIGGGPLTRSVGDALDRSGVKLIVGYGTTEVGPISQPVLESYGHGWEYFQFRASSEPVLVPVDGDTTGALFQLILKQSATNCLVLPNMEVDGILAYDTKDILQRHPTVPTLYRVYGRVDDQIMHSNGEKTNPGPIEQILAQDPHVKAAIMFGRERSHAGVIIAPSQDILDVESFRDAIWPTVEQANATAPSHSRLFKDMIVLATPSRPFQVSAKGTPRRQAILEDYAQEIDAAYVAFNRVAAPAGPQVHGKFSINDALEIVRGQVHTNVRPSISDNENLFDAGADSLVAARIRRGIIHVLGGRIPEMVVQALPDDIVFMSPTIAQLASFVYGVSISASAVTDRSDLPYKNVPVSILDNKDTIVRLREPAAGEPPLILVHGGTGFIYAFVYFQKHFRTGLWAIQVVTETPCTNFITQTDFYYRKIKEVQPTGPYRIGGYSSGVFMAYRIAKLLEEHGDNVIQLALIDSSPLLTLAPRAVDPYTAETDFADPETLKAHHERGVRGLCALMRGYKNPWWPKFADYTWERWNGRKSEEEVSELMAAAYENLVVGSVKAFEFALSLGGEQRVYTEVMHGMIAWMGEVKAPVTLYKASRGVIAGIAPEAQKEWWALGLNWCCAELQVVEVDVDHNDIVSRDELVEDLQNIGT